MDGYDLTRTVPMLSMICLGITCFISIAVPVAAFQIARKRFFGKWQTLLYGAADFLILDFLLCNMVLVGFVLIPGMNDFIETLTPLYVLLTTLIVSAIAEVGRYLMLDMLAKRKTTLGNVMMFATGIAGIRSILMIANNSFQSLTIAMTVNETGLQTLAEAAGDDAEAMLASLEPLFANSPYLYLISGLDVMISFAFHVALSIILYAAVTKRAPKYILPAAVGLRFVYEIPTYLYSYHVVITNLALAEIIAVLATVGAVCLAYYLAKNYLSEDIALIENQKNMKQAFPKFNDRSKKGDSTGSIRKNATMMPPLDKKTDDKN